MTDEKPATNYRSSNLPDNSHKAKEKPPERKALERITATNATRRKPTVGRRIAATFKGDDAQAVGNSILLEVVVPAVKTLISDAFTQGVDRMLFGEARRGPARTPGGPAYTSYNASYNKPARPIMSDRRELSSRARATHEFSDIVVGTRGEAEGVIDRLNDAIREYGVVSVNDLYDLVGITGSFTDDRWGWRDIRGSGLSRVRDGYVLSLPRPEPIE